MTQNIVFGQYYWLKVKGIWEIGLATEIPYAKEGIGFKRMGDECTYYDAEDYTGIKHIPFPKEDEANDTR